MFVEESEHALDVGEGLADSVHHAEEIERRVELDEEGVDQNQVAQGHRTRHDPRRPAIIMADPSGDDRLLSPG